MAFQQDFRIVSDGLPHRQRSRGVIDFRLEIVKYGRAVLFDIPPDWVISKTPQFETDFSI